MKLFKNKFFWTILSIIAFVIIVPTLMPTPIDMDLNKIGNGQKSVVFVYDLNLAVSNPQTIEINKAREILGESVTFLIVKSGDPETAEFKKRYNAHSPDLLFFDSDGKLINRQAAPISSEALVEQLSGK